MKRRFTILTAALALLTFLAVPMGMWGQTTYEQLTSIANIDEDAQYVLGIDGTGFHYSNTSGWGLTGLPEEHTPYYYRLVVAADGQSFKAYIDTPIYGNTYYMTIPTSNAFTMTTSSDAANTDLIIGTTCTGVSTPNYAVANKTTTARHLRRNGSSGLRSYAGTTGSIAYFYKVVTSSGPVQLDAPTLTATPSNEKVTLTWNSINGASSYTIQYADNTSFTGATTITNATSPKEISGLTNGTTYYFKAMSVGDGSDYLSSDYGTVVSSTPANVVTITITQDAIAGFTNVYNWYDWSVSDISGKLYAYKSGGMQFNSSKTAYWIYNTTAVPGNITSVKMTKASGTDRSWTLKAGNSAMTTTSDGTQIGNAQTVGTSGATWNVSGDYNYFLLYVSGGSTVISSIEITYTPTSASDPSISADDVEIAYDATSGSIMGEIVNYVEGTVSATTDADWISNFTYDQADEIFEVDFAAAVNPSAVARTANVTLTFTYGNNETTTKNVTVSQAGNPNGPGTQNNPYTVAQAIDAIDNDGNMTGVYATGIVSNVDYYSENNHYITYYISADGSTTGDQLEAFHGKGINGADFSSIDDIQVGDVVVIYGNLTKYNSTYEFAADNELVSLVRPAQYTLTAAMTNVSEYFVFVGEDEIEFDENNQAQVRAGATVGVSIAAMEDCFIFGSLTVNGSSEGVTQEDPNDPYFTFEMPEGNATIDVTSSAATQYTLTVAGLNNVTYTDMLAGVGSEEVTLTNNQATLCEGINVDIVGLSANAGLSLQSVTLNDGTTTTTLELEYGVYHFNMPSSNATLTFTTATAPVYTLATTIESGKTYIIVNQENSRAMGAQNNNNRAAVEVVMDNNKITVSSDDVYEFVIESVGENVYSIYDARTGGYLYAASNSSNYLKTETELDADGNGKWTISIGENDGVSIVAQGTNGHNNMRFNANNGNPIFSCYASTSNLPKVSLYVKDETETYTLENITGYTGEKDHYYLIASPVTVDLTNHDLTTGDFDLYYFDQAQEDEWRNYEATAFNLVPGSGYLYAKEATTENPTYSFELTGTPYAGNGTIDLDYDANAEFPGFNLIGNPFGTNANLDQPYYRLNSDGSALNTTTESTQVLVMEGVFVQATTSIRTATFSSAAKRVSQLNVKVTRNRSAVLDNAIIRFDEGATLSKFQLNPNSTKLYITEGNQDYAVVRSNNAGEMPVNFKAAEDGNYTLSIETENVEASYLHLIDNMTGADVDLLATPSYSFEARTTDYANRFRLEFNINGVEENNATTNFAYFNGSSWTVNNMGEATLQVVDMMGRVLSTETISGNTEVNLNQAAGVYMLRLVNGNDVKVQKVVVR